MIWRLVCKEHHNRAEFTEQAPKLTGPSMPTIPDVPALAKLPCFKELVVRELTQLNELLRAKASPGAFSP